MPQSIIAQIGQCGNQIGCRFWDLALREHEQHKLNSPEDMDSFFKQVNQSDKSKSILNTRKARAILIDMEEGVISGLLKGPLQNIFDSTQLITDVSGSGNNWAVGNKIYGCKYKENVIQLFRKEAEICDSLQSFFLLHSMGGGTGSGLGTAVLKILYEEFPKTSKFVFSVFPSKNDDVITSPYNTVLSNNELIEYADCVIPFENEALADICHKVGKIEKHVQMNRNLKLDSVISSAGAPARVKKAKAFDEMNNIVANTLLNMTCSSRFPGNLNVDLNEIIMNMTPYPRLHYLISGVAPLFSLPGVYKVDQVFSDPFLSSHQLFRTPLKQGTFLSCALLCRGQIPVSDVQNNIDKIKQSLKFVKWSEDAWKIGLCSIPPVGSQLSVLMLANNTSIRHSFSRIESRCMLMFRKRAHLHHFLEVDSMERDTFEQSLYNLTSLIEEYKTMEKVNVVETLRKQVLV